MSTLVITKQTGNFFSIQLDSQEPIVSEQNRLTTVGNFCHFKTVSGANIIKEQNISFADITLVASGTFTFSSINSLWLKLIDVGFFNGLGTSASGTGVDNFTELLDTFNSYIGRDGQALVVNESQQEIQTVPFANVSKFIDLSDAPNPLLPNKMIVTNANGTALIMTDLPTPLEQFLQAFGYIDYANSATSQNAVSGVELKLTNDKLGNGTDVSNAPFGVSSLFDSNTNQFDFSQLNVGDWIDFRPDLLIDLLGTNTSFKLYMKMAIGSTAEWILPIYNGERKSTDGFSEVPYTGFYIGSQNEIDFPAELYILTDANATVKVNGFLFKIIRKGINIVDIDAVRLTTDQTIEGVKTFVSSPIVPDATLPNQAVNFGQVIPITGTTAGNPITGDLEVEENASKTIWTKGGNYPDDFNSIVASQTGFSLSYKNLVNSIERHMQVGVFDGFLITDNSPTSRGLSSINNFSLNITDLDYTQKIYVDTNFYKRKVIQDNTVSEITAPTLFIEEILSIMSIPSSYIEQNEVFEYLQNLSPDNNNAEYKTYITDDPNNLSFGQYFFINQYSSNTALKKIETKFLYRNGVFINIPNDTMVQAGSGFASDITLNANIPLYIVTTVLCNTAVGLMQSNFKMLRKIN